ncbi:MAG: SusC/RagA family TonB-linked outer membrane protein [Flavobacteriaceae bacterium]|nr:SusC/RagA family TonB-linked outer membrane protein [Flavobacteriaceae bacterium]
MKQSIQYGIIWLLGIALLSPLFGWSQGLITGTVSDENGAPLPGATVVVEETNQGTTTDFDGNYQINAAQGQTLVFSYVGYDTESVSISSSMTVNMQMQAANELDEVVVTSLGISRAKKSLGYSQQSVQGETLVQTKEVDLNITLAGKIAGVQMIGGSSSTFDSGFLRLRGETGVLYVMDGVKVYSISDINTNNIDNISVLKGAAATALYGADALNGVVIITSKKAASGEASLTVDHTTSVASVSILPEYQNEYGGGYYQEWDVFEYNPSTDPDSYASFDGQKIPYYAADESWGPKLDGTLVRHWDSWIPGHPEFGKLRPWEPNPDNVRDFFEMGITNNTSITFSKGDDNYNLNTSLRNLSQSLVIPEAKRDQIDYNFSGSVDISERFNFYSSINYQFRETVNEPLNGYGGLGSNFIQWWQRQVDIDRVKENYFFEGNYYSWNSKSARDAKPLYWDAPHFGPEQNKKFGRKDNLFGNFGLNYKINEDFKFNFETRRRFNNYLGNSRVAFGGLDLPSFSEYNYRYIQNEIYSQINYNKRFNEIDINALAGLQLQKNWRNLIFTNSVGGLSVPNFYSVATSVDRPNYSSSLVQSRLVSNFAQISFGFKSMLYLDASYRLDWGSTANAEKNRISTLGVSGSFLIHEIFDLGNAVSLAKLRSGFSQAPIFPKPYRTTSVYNVGSPYGGNASFSVPNTEANANLAGGNRTEFEFGLELKFLTNRLGIDVAYFDRKDKELPISVPVTASSGFTGLSINSGQTSSKGYEITLNATPFKRNNFNWDISLNFATLEKTVDFLGEESGDDGVNVLDSWVSWGGLQLQEIVGEEWGTFVGRKRKYDSSGTPILDEDGSFVYDTNEKLGSILPDFTGGFLSTIQYKDFYLNLGFDFQSGGLFYTTTNMFAYYSGLHIDTVGNNDKGKPVRDAIDAGGGYHVVGVTEDGSPVDIYMESQSWGGRYFGTHDEWLYDASYLKLRQLRLGYSLPSKFLESSFINNVDVSIIGNNLLLLYSNIKHGGLDPSEIEGTGSIAGEYRQAEGGQLPPTRSIGLNVKLNF